ncbi:MAG TPA: NIPSNAP family protein [Bryobacteraceae bacterium]|nr:NIPSNAP family protein [Bryobacteraceae bacterium]
MRKRLVLAGFSGMVLGAALTCLGLRVGMIQSVQAAPQAADAAAAKGGGKGKKQATSTAPCGPNIQGDLGKNTAKDSRCFELRMYTVDPSRDGVGQFKGGIDDLHKRFREGEVEVFRKNGVDVMAVWQNLDDPNTLVYLLSYKDRAAREAGWAGFNADPEWTKLRLKYFVPLNAKVTFMSATDYSPLK